MLVNSPASDLKVPLSCIIGRQVTTNLLPATGVTLQSVRYVDPVFLVFGTHRL